MPRSDSGRAATAVTQWHGRGLRDAPRTVIQALRIAEEPLRHERSNGGFRKGRSHHSGAGAIARPSSAEEGIKMSNL